MDPPHWFQVPNIRVQKQSDAYDKLPGEESYERPGTHFEISIRY